MLHEKTTPLDLDAAPQLRGIAQMKVISPLEARYAERHAQKLRDEGYWWQTIPGDEDHAIGWDGPHTSDWYRCADGLPSLRKQATFGPLRRRYPGG